MSSADNKLLELLGVSKQFPGVKALSNVDFTVQGGEVHALVGQNGAGKSTLVKIISGIYPPDSGRILWCGRPVFIPTPRAAHNLGISIVPQESQAVPELTIADNMFLGKYPQKGFARLGIVDVSTMRRELKKVADRLNLSLDPSRKVKFLSVAQLQILSLVKALLYNPQLIILDEVSAALTPQEIEQVFSVIKRLSQSGMSCIYISHRIAEVHQIADRVTILRDGVKVGTYETQDVQKDKLIRLMIGKDMEAPKKKKRYSTGEILLEARNLTIKPTVKNCSITVREGEIIGIAGLVGAGRTELLRCMFGAEQCDSGDLIISGRKVEMRKFSPKQASQLGIGLIPENRKEQGLVLGQSVLSNMSLSSLNKFTKAGLVFSEKEEKAGLKLKNRLDIKLAELKQIIANLSGGNQQKVVLSKWILKGCPILLLDEPTKGIDVGAKEEVYAVIEDLARQKFGIILVSSEITEILRLADRIFVMYKGTLLNEINRDKASEEVIMRYATTGQ